MSKLINVKFPFKDSVKGFFLGMNEDDDSAIKSDLMHLLLTNVGERYYLPDYGTNIRKHIFEPNDDITHSEIKSEINEAISKYIPNLIVNEFNIEYKEDDDYFAMIKFYYTISEGVFERDDELIIKF
jgi:hypothetical protein